MVSDKWYQRSGTTGVVTDEWSLVNNFNKPIESITEAESNELIGKDYSKLY